MTKRQILIAALILLLAAIARLVLLDIKPPHFDEGINGWFSDQMSKTGYYSYDPTNYHGPLHFYVIHAFLGVLGRNLWALRLPVALVGTLTTLVILFCSASLGSIVAFTAAFAYAISPGFVFYNRYSIHETWLVFFMVLIFWGILSWRTHRIPALWSIILGATGMILTKETYILHLTALAAAAPVYFFLRLLRPSGLASGQDGNRIILPDPISFRSHLISALVIALFLLIFFYSGNFQRFEGLKGLYQTFQPWTKTGVGAAGHGKPDYDLVSIWPSWFRFAPAPAAVTALKLNWYWVKLMATYEWLVILGLVFSLRYLVGGPAVLRYLAIYAFGTLLIYSVIPYKTPWCIISIAWPYFFLAGDLLRLLATHVHPALALAAGAVAWGHDGYKSWRLNFVNFESAREMYVYVQTYRDYGQFVDPILAEIKEKPGLAARLHGLVFLSSYYPIPWVLGDLPNIGYYGKEGQWPSSVDADFVAIEDSEAKRLEALLRDRYYTTVFRLRNGMDDCRAYFRFETFRDYFRNREPDFSPAAARP